MKICIYGSASPNIDEKYIKATEALGQRMAECGHELVFGAGPRGCMGAAARGVKAGGGKVTGILPRYLAERGLESAYEGCDEVIYTDTLNERKRRMEELADAYIICPGGIGTLDEAFETITLKQTGDHLKPIAFFSVDGYYEKLRDMLQNMQDLGFFRYDSDLIYRISGDIDEILTYIQSPQDALSGRAF